METQFSQSFGEIARNSAKIAFPQNCYTTKGGEITVFYAMKEVLTMVKNHRYSVLPTVSNIFEQFLQKQISE